MHHELALLFQAPDGYKPHVGAGHSFTDSRCIGSIVLAAFAGQPVGHHELGRHQAHGVAEPLEFASPVVGTRARFHTNETWWQRGDEFEQLGTLHAGTQKYRFACGINAMHSKDILCQIDSDGDNVSHGLPLPTSE